ncbi:MAG: protein kinase [Lentisphaerae bacterium]|nr:protein kinase [Lentisphaerota bacterium]
MREAPLPHKQKAWGRMVPADPLPLLLNLRAGDQLRTKAAMVESDVTLEAGGEHEETLDGRDTAGLNSAHATLSIRSEGVGSSDTARSRLHLHPHIFKASEEVDGGDLDYELTRTLGKGGMGVVYQARQVSLDRRIAVKMIQSDAEADPVAASKFLSEAMVTGELDHPNIIPVHDLGRTADGKLFYAMKEIEGFAWSEVIREKSFSENLRILLAVSDAIGFAHAKGVIHRDLKPANVMVGGFGEVLVMDWGLAASIGNDKAEPLTEHASLAGTPAYMAPEMALCDYEAMGCTSDVYLLGAILYEMITGSPPHPGDNARDAIDNAMENIIRPAESKSEWLDVALRALATEPTKRYATVAEFQAALHECQAHVESLNLTTAAADRLDAVAATAGADAYREFNEIIGGFQQALHLWVGNRRAVYGLRAAREEFTRLALARDDLSLAGSQVRAIEADVKRWPLPGMQLARPDDLAAKVAAAQGDAVRRRRVVRLSVVAAIVAGLAAFAVMVMAYVVTRGQRDLAVRAETQMQEERNRAVAAEEDMHLARDRAEAAAHEEERQRVQAVAALAAAERETYYHTIALAAKRISARQGRAAEAMLWKVPSVQRGWEWGRLLYAAQGSLATLAAHSGTVASVTFSPDSHLVLSEGADQTVRVWDLSGGDRGGVFSGHAASTLPLRFTADGKQILWGVDKGRVQFMDVASHRLTSKPLETFYPMLYQAMFSPDGTRLIASGAQGDTAVWQLDSGRRIADLTGHLTAVAAVALDQSGDLLATGSRDGRAAVWRLSDGVQLKSFGPHPGAVTGVAFDEGAIRLTTVSEDALLRVWDVATGRSLEVMPFLGLEAPLSAVTFDGASRRLLALTGANVAQVWDASTGQRRLELMGHDGVVTAAAFSPDGQLAVTGARDGELMVWDASQEGGAMTLGGHAGAVVTARFDPTASRVVTAAEDGYVRIWDTTDGRLIRTLNRQTGRLTCATFSPDGRQIVSASDGGTTRIWDAESGGMLRALSGHGGAITWSDYSPDGRRLVTAGQDGLRVWEVDSGTRPLTIRADQAVSRVALFSPDGRHVLMAGAGVQIWDAVSGEDAGRFDGHSDHVAAVAFSPDGQWVISGSRDMTARVWRLADQEEQLVLRGDDSAVSAVAFSPDGRRVATAGKQGIHIWDASSGSELLALDGHDGWVSSLVFSADGHALLSAGNDGTARIWPAVSWTASPEAAHTERDQRRSARLSRLLAE